ncbi:amidohydrolase family protein [Amycolatopsis rhizosphaerae]|uniref:Amidohydrolase family protein n=1 Tax=Amycolatopsis rhizosphaerae TaxID=2053003 RepID=A0A558AWL1_9PSEU|nr:amidohydrolase family protein [Amycolatopsis rhizosphaerae]TVT28656.1 amidohydrolase family protein [Amycolatopsis rhizosphaerae]
MVHTVVDVHSHPIVDFGDGEDAGLGLPIGAAPPWSAHRLLELMDEHDVAATVLSLPNAANRIADRSRAAGQARRSNEYLAGLVAEHPARFGGLAVLPGRSTDDSLEEIAYALDVLHLDGVSFSTSVADEYLGSPRFDPLLAELSAREATLFVHPVEAVAARPIDGGLNPSIFEFVFDTTRMIATMVVHRVHERFPRLRVIATHGGGTMPYLARRFQVLQNVFGAGEGRAPLTEQELTDGLRWFYYDLTAATSPAQLPALLDLMPTSRLLAGFDHPYMPASTYAESLRQLRRSPLLTPEDRSRIAHGNAAALFPALAARSAIAPTSSGPAD